jgi:hypothetical protein
VILLLVSKNFLEEPVMTTQNKPSTWWVDSRKLSKREEILRQETEEKGKN